MCLACGRCHSLFMPGWHPLVGSGELARVEVWRLPPGLGDRWSEEVSCIISFLLYLITHGCAGLRLVNGSSDYPALTLLNHYVGGRVQPCSWLSIHIPSLNLFLEDYCEMTLKQIFVQLVDTFLCWSLVNVGPLLRRSRQPNLGLISMRWR